MERIQRIWEHSLYQEAFRKLQRAERERIFCSHTLAHFLDVARLMYIYSLEEEGGGDKPLIYAAALLHDIGRWEQLERGTPHEEAGAALAGRILPDCGFQAEEILAIQRAISLHRGGEQKEEAALRGNCPSGEKLAVWLYRADKQSRCCFACDAAGECNWNQEKRNLRIVL